MKYIAILPSLTLFTANVLAGEVKSNNEKLADDPTKITTQLGISYSDYYDFGGETIFISGSLALDEVRKLNVSANSSGSEWRVGGSWLFDIGIVNFNFGKNEFEDGSTQTNYSIGTFMPLSYFGFQPLGIQIFPMAGYSYNDGENKCYVNNPGSPCFNETPEINEDYIMVSNQAHSGYLGAFALKPLSESWTLMAMGGGSAGSNDYSGYWLGGGVGYSLSESHSFSIFTFLVDNSYGSEEKFGVSYKYQL
ncbi:hypothetical protein L3Q72_00230 [Vibrio sp. JC009]|uniref:hypothetical protein n=1 Tax=Vibrio sp. JC009 TaxID=2912314 RepID=UPI0023AF011A|nr:hypothetical protein [Vibrio sp. JC009]WED21881.1 hypothetical protein L3Q72_00230 [Vibrio sp. JC009]